MKTAKAWIGFGTAVLGALTTAMADDVWNASDGTQVAIAVVTALSVAYGVWRTPNKEE